MLLDSQLFSLHCYVTLATDLRCLLDDFYFEYFPNSVKLIVSLLLSKKFPLHFYHSIMLSTSK